MAALYGDDDDGVCVTDARGSILYANPALARLLGVPRAAEAGRLCELLCDRLARGAAQAPSRSCPLLDGAAGESRTYFSGLYGTTKRYKWSVDGVLIASDPPFLHADCLRLGKYGSDWDGLHVMRVERVGGRERPDPPPGAERPDAREREGRPPSPD